MRGDLFKVTLTARQNGVRQTKKQLNFDLCTEQTSQHLVKTRCVCTADTQVSEKPSAQLGKTPPKQPHNLYVTIVQGGLKKYARDVSGGVLTATVVELHLKNQQTTTSERHIPTRWFSPAFACCSVSAMISIIEKSTISSSTKDAKNQNTL